MKNHKEEYITLYPSNWLYNASILGFLKVLEHDKKNDFEIKETLNISKSLLKLSYDGII